MRDQVPILAVTLAFLLVFVNIFIAVYMSRRTATAKDYFVAGGKVKAFPTASAMSGDYLSAASFLGVAGIVFMSGFDGVWYAFGFFVGFIFLLMFIATPLKKFGQYTIPDFVAARFNSSKARFVGVLCVLSIILFYIAPQMLGVGKVLALFLNLEYKTAVISSIIVITLYVSIGGMKGTTLNQVIQFWLMATAMLAVCIVALSKGMTYPRILEGIAAFKGSIPGTDVLFDGSKWVNPGGWLDLKDSISLLFALCFGTAGLPHILVRFYTSKSGSSAKWLVILVLFFIGMFYITSPYVGAAIRYAFINGDMLPMNQLISSLMTDGRNLAVPVAGEFFGGELLLGIVVAGAIAAVLSTVAGLLLTASGALGHDVYTTVINTKATEKQRIRAGKISVIIMGIVAGTLGIMVENMQIAVLVGLAFAVAGSTFFPILFLGIWWKGMTCKGAITGLLTGLISSIVLIIFASYMPSFLQFENPALITIPLSFLTIYVVSKIDGQVPENVNEFMYKLHGPEQVTK